MAVQEVIVVGGGLAGLCASIEAVANGAHVTLIEKENALGGNSAKATSGLNGAGTTFQQMLGLQDDWQSLEKDTISSGDGLSNNVLVKTLASNSNAAINFLNLLGIKLDDVVQLGGHSVARTHRFSPTEDGRPVPVGFTVISKLRKHIEADLSDHVTVFLKSKFISLIHKEGQVVGIKYSSPGEITKELFGNVILTAGGYAHDQSNDSLLKIYAPSVYNLPTTNGHWATGDVIKAVAGDGISLIHMDKVQVHPTGFLDQRNVNSSTKFLAPESLRGCGAILVNADGKRFVNELGRRDHVTGSIFNNCGNFQNNPHNPVACAMLFNDEVAQKFGSGAFNFYKSKDLIQDVGNLEELSRILNVDSKLLELTLTEYKQYSSQGSDNFNKTTFPVLFEPDDHFYVAYVTPARHYCMGGIEINEKSQVLASSDKKPIPGLFAAGEVTGGVHGQNRLGGNSLLECVVFGRIAGREASKSNQVVHEEM